MMEPKHFLAGMAEWGMAHIVQQGCSIKQGAILAQFRRLSLEVMQRPAGQL
jgi:hypothetical protein